MKKFAFVLILAILTLIALPVPANNTSRLYYNNAALDTEVGLRNFMLDPEFNCEEWGTTSQYFTVISCY